MFRKKKMKTITVVVEERRQRVIKRKVDVSPPPAKPKVPLDSEICRSIEILQNLLEWKPPKRKNDWADKVIPQTLTSRYCVRSNSLQNKESVPKTLYCHITSSSEDKFVLGSVNENPFSFFHWSGIDIFVYFSHSLITIPPLGWINAAHTHGVTILGTIITEGEKGEEIFKTLLEDKKMVLSFCRNAARIANHYKFSGYLLNIENNIGQRHLSNLMEFVKELRKELKIYDKDNILIWYDSVAFPHGDVCYQNELNHRNCTFFDLADGIYLNYNWTDENLKFTKRFAETRANDVFVGVDIFGRGSHKGGFDSYQALEKIRKYKLSTALFAPGWVYEGNQTSFLTRDYYFWKSMYPFLYISGPRELPFRTSFSTGFGPNFFLDGVIFAEGPWFNLSRQEYVPTEILPWEGTCENSTISLYKYDAYRGGNSVIIKNQNFERLFFCEFPCNKCDVLEISSMIKSFGKEDGELEILLKYIENSEQKEIVLKHSEGSYEANNWRKRVYFFGPRECTLIEIGCRLFYEEEMMLLGEISLKRIKGITKV